MTYQEQGDKYFDYDTPADVARIRNNLYEWEFRFVVKSGHNSINKKFNKIIESVSKPIFEMQFDDDIDKVYLGIGFEFLLKALVLEKGFVVHKVDSFESIKQISDLTNADKVHFGKMISLEYIKNHLDDFGIDSEDKTFDTLESVRNWRNRIIHQEGSGEENSSQ